MIEAFGRRIAHRIDARDLACPLPVLKARKLLRQLAAGQLVLVEATDPMAALDIPHLCNEDGHRLVASDKDGKLLRFLIERGAGVSSGRTPR
jgi:tRNA 2-thiouridine synthesizing protein A